MTTLRSTLTVGAIRAAGAGTADPYAAREDALIEAELTRSRRRCVPSTGAAVEGGEERRARRMAAAHRLGAAQMLTSSIPLAEVP